MAEFSFWIACFIDGLSNGFVYGMFSLCLVITYRASKDLNFASTSIAALILCGSAPFAAKVPFAALASAIIVVGFLVGTMLHFGVMRFITENRRAINTSEVIVVVGIFTICDAFSGLMFGDEPTAFPSMFGEQTREIMAGVAISNNSFGVIGVAFIVMFCLMLLYRFSKIGLLMEAVSENVTAARLRGIRASNILAIAWGVSGALGATGAILIAPTVFVYPAMLAPVFMYSLIAAVVGGMESPMGAIIGGILIGIIENFAANIDFIGSELKFGVVFLFLVIMLIVKPRGLLGKADLRRV